MRFNRSSGIPLPGSKPRSCPKSNQRMWIFALNSKSRSQHIIGDLKDVSWPITCYFVKNGNTSLFISIHFIPIFYRNIKCEHITKKPIQNKEHKKVIIIITTVMQIRLTLNSNSKIQQFRILQPPFLNPNHRGSLY